MTVHFRKHVEKQKNLLEVDPRDLIADISIKNFTLGAGSTREKGLKLRTYLDSLVNENQPAELNAC